MPGICLMVTTVKPCHLSSADTLTVLPQLANPGKSWFPSGSDFSSICSLISLSMSPLLLYSATLPFVCHSLGDACRQSPACVCKAPKEEGLCVWQMDTSPGINASQPENVSSIAPAILLPAQAVHSCSFLAPSLVTIWDGLRAAIALLCSAHMSTLKSVPPALFAHCRV